MESRGDDTGEATIDFSIAIGEERQKVIRTERKVTREQMDAIFDLLGVFPRQKPQIDWPKEVRIQVEFIEERIREVEALLAMLANLVGLAGFKEELIRSLQDLKGKIGVIKSTVSPMKTWGQ